MHEVRDVVRVRALGSNAAHALGVSGGRVAPLPEFASSPYRLAAGEMVWIGTAGHMHPRAVFVDAMPPGASLDADGARVWTAPSTGLGVAQRSALVGTMRKLMPALASRAGDHGFAPLLAGRRPAFPLAARSQDALNAGAAANTGDTGSFARAAARLIGAGSGLTPSGDDFLGGALFAVAHLPSGAADWSACATAIGVLARSGTHCVSAALLADLTAGASFAPLHALVHAAAREADQAELMRHVDDVVTIGHSSGWDMLTGIMSVIAGLPAFAPNT